MPVDTNQPVDTIAPWTIKAFPTDARRRIVRTAELQELTVGQFIEKLLDGWEGKPVGNQANHVPGGGTGTLLGLLNTPGAPKWLRTGAARRLGGLLGIPAPETRPGPRRRLAGPGGTGTGEGGDASTGTS